MGMFDYLVVELVLPDGTPPEKVFQTKSLDCVMKTFVITHNGELYKEEWDYEYVSDPEHLLGGYERKIPSSYRREYLPNFSGHIIFYDGKVNGKWRDYTALFVNGKLTAISYADTAF